MKTTNIYLAADWDDRDATAKLGTLIRTISPSLTIVSRWHDHEPSNLAMSQIAWRDLIDLGKADTLVFRSYGIMKDDADGFRYTRGGGGRHTELGFALRAAYKIYLIGPIESIFQELIPARYRFDTDDGLLAHLILDNPPEKKT